MKLRDGLIEARQLLEQGGIDEPSLEAEVLLRHALGIDRARLYASLEDNLPEAVRVNLLYLLNRRLSGEPSAYITGHREFFGLDFIVDKRVLIPRPETELLVETAIAWCRKCGWKTIADIGTGSGVIAVSLAVNLPGVSIIAVDISPDALETARTNGVRHNVAGRVTFLEGDLLAPLPGKVDLICANLPYVTEAELPPGGPLSREPRLALHGGPEGLDYLLRICRQAPGYLNPGGGILLETGEGQAGAVCTALKTAFPGSLIVVLKDLAGTERLVCLSI